jgi:hypothetical protein
MIVPSMSKKKSGIYCIMNITNNKRYIGSSINIHQRLLVHRAYLRNNTHTNTYLQNAFDKYTENSFMCFVLEYCDVETLTEREQYYINLFNSEYNITKDVVRLTRSNESKAKQSIARKLLYEQDLIAVNCAKTINVYDIKGVFINSFKSLGKAANHLNINRTSIQRVLQGKHKQVNGYIFLDNRELTLKDLIFAKHGKLVVLKKEDKFIYFRSITSCAEYLKEELVSVGAFIRHTKRELFKNKYKLDLIKPCELLERLEADNQQPSDIEIY